MIKAGVALLFVATGWVNSPTAIVKAEVTTNIQLRSARNVHGKDATDRTVDRRSLETQTYMFNIGLKTSQLEEISHYVDWEKLRDEYLTALYSENSTSSRRMLKARAARKHPKKNRRKTWDVEAIEKNLEEKAAHAIEQARGVTKRGGKKDKGSKKPSAETSPTDEALKAAHKAGKQQKSSNAQAKVPKAKFSKSPNPPGQDALEESTLPTSSAPVSESATTSAPVSTNTAAPVASSAPATISPFAPISPALSPVNLNGVVESNSGNKAVVDVDEFPIAEDIIAGIEKDAMRQSIPRQGDDASFNGKPIPVYQYSPGNCPGDGDSTAAVPCAPDNLPQICSKYNSDNLGSFEACFTACMPSFCCIHDAPPATNFISPNCNTDVNCAGYAYCYIVWWKLHDTIGPATQLRLEQNDDFYDVPPDFVQGDVTNIQFYREMLFHHFDDAQEIIRLGTVQVNDTYSFFNSDLIFLNETYWNTTI